MAKYRLYIDESGHHRYKISPAIKERYLGLTGIIVEQSVYAEEVVPRIEKIRKLFYSDPDFKPALHLEDIMSGKKEFINIRNPDVKKVFDEQLISLYTDVEYKIITVVIDKTAHFTRYVTPEHPYHYNLACMLERYCKFLDWNDAHGDVMAEARGPKEDRKLREVYTKFFDQGTQYMPAPTAKKTLTSKDIKLKTKKLLTPGLEMADLLALCSKLDIMHSEGRLQSLSNNFTKTVIEAIQPKYFTGPSGVRGNGKKFL